MSNPYEVIAPPTYPDFPVAFPSVWIDLPAGLVAGESIVHRDFSSLSGVGSFKA